MAIKRTPIRRKPVKSQQRLLFRPRARILKTLGDELISSEVVALIELVKNAYDADASRVMVKFSGPLKAGNGSVSVFDDGHGMSLQTVQTTWMEPATIVKKKKIRSEEKRRRMLGEKGVGRFASSRLAQTLELITRRKANDKEVRVSFDWSDFDNDEKFLDEIQIELEERIPGAICTGGGIESLWSDRSSVPAEETDHGTILSMAPLKSTWQEQQLRDLREGLSRLISPFFGRNKAGKKDEFSILLDLPDEFEHLSGPVEPPEALKRPQYAIKGKIDSSGKYDLEMRLKGQDDFQPTSGEFTFKDEHKPTCGPFQIELRIWDRDRDSLMELSSLYGSTIKNVREDLDQAAGINVYRDEFRVLPYGEPQNDWLRLDLRSRLNPTLRLANNQIVGYVLISADRNPELRDQSNREGLMKGPALEDLRGLIIMVLGILEPERYKALRPDGAKTKRKDGLFSDFDLGIVRQLVRKRYPNDVQLLKALGEKEEDLKRRMEDVQEILARYHRLATLGQLIDTILHDGRAPLAKIKNEAHLGSREIDRSPKKAIVEKLKGRFDLIWTQSDVMKTLFQKIEPFGGRKRGRPARIGMEKMIADAFSVMDREIEEVGVSVKLPEGETIVKVDQTEIQEVLINLLQNSLYWLRKVPRSERRVVVEVKRVNSEEVKIVFADSGPGIDKAFQKRIFDPYFSTKPDGVGLGLAIAGDIVTDYYDGDLLLVESGLLKGAMFEITLRKRV